jgi:hypothetical protein
MLLSDYSRHQLLPEKDFVGFVPPQLFIPTVGHHRNGSKPANGGPTMPSITQAL